MPTFVALWIQTGHNDHMPTEETKEIKVATLPCTRIGARELNAFKRAWKLAAKGDPGLTFSSWIRASLRETAAKLGVRVD